MSRILFRHLAWLMTLGLISVACTATPPTTIDASTRVDGTESEVVGVLRSPLTGAAGGSPPQLTVTALGTNRRTVSTDVQSDGSFSLKLARNASYTLNVLDKSAGAYVGSFLFRVGSQPTVAMRVQDSRILLGVCQFLSGEVWCENGFFDSPTADGEIEPASDVHGTLRATIQSSGDTASLLIRLLGGSTIDLELHPNPQNPFQIALFNRTRSACGQPLVGTAERRGTERYLYTQNTYSSPTCRATVRYQATCTMATSGVCEGFMRVDVSPTPVGTADRPEGDCSDFPAVHVAEPFSATVSEPGRYTCTLPSTCARDSDCDSRHCQVDVGFCAPQSRTGSLMVHAFDVGQGDATLVITPNGKSLLIDGGRAQAGRGIAALVRRLAGRLDAIVTTHFDGDHASGIPAIVLGPDGAPGRKGVDDNANQQVDDDAEIGTAGSDDLLPAVAIDRGTEPGAAALDNYLRAVGSRRRTAVLGEYLDLGDPSVEVRVVSVNGAALGSSQSVTPNDENDRSVGLLIRSGEFSMLTLGDLPGGGARRLEQALAASVGPVDVLRPSHHGSADSSQPEFLSIVRPRVALISVGDSDSCGAGFNTYGLPAQSTITHLIQSGVQAIYQTEQGGQSFGSGCVPGASDPARDYGTIPHTFSYATIDIEASSNSFRVRGPGFDDFYSAAP